MALYLAFRNFIISFSFFVCPNDKLNKNKIKGWNYHKKMTVTLVILVGKVKVVIYDPKKQIFNKFIINFI